MPDKHKDVPVRMTSIELPISVLDHIDSFKSRYVTRTAIVIEALEDWLESKEGMALPRTNQKIQPPSQWIVGR